MQRGVILLFQLTTSVYVMDTFAKNCPQLGLMDTLLETAHKSQLNGHFCFIVHDLHTHHWGNAY